jgi:hypothetical protein
MKAWRIWLFPALALLVFATLTSTLKAGDWDRTMSATFDNSIAVPGQVLPAGTYVFKMRNDTIENVVQIWNEDQTKLVATLSVVPEQLAKSRDNPSFTIENKGSVPRLESVFYPGDLTGYQFNYHFTSTER